MHNHVNRLGNSGCCPYKAVFQRTDVNTFMMNTNYELNNQFLVLDAVYMLQAVNLQMMPRKVR